MWGHAPGQQLLQATATLRHLAGSCVEDIYCLLLQASLGHPHQGLLVPQQLKHKISTLPKSGRGLLLASERSQLPSSHPASSLDLCGWSCRSLLSAPSLVKVGFSSRWPVLLGLYRESQDFLFLVDALKISSVPSTYASRPPEAHRQLEQARGLILQRSRQTKARTRECKLCNL